MSPTIPFGVVPQENTIFGSVIETYDQLRHSNVGKGLFVVGEVTLGVQHCLLARKGVPLSDIKNVLSHEQVGFNSPYAKSPSEPSGSPTVCYIGSWTMSRLPFEGFPFCPSNEDAVNGRRSGGYCYFRGTRDVGSDLLQDMHCCVSRTRCSGRRHTGYEW